VRKSRLGDRFPTATILRYTPMVGIMHKITAIHISAFCALLRPFVKRVRIEFD